MRYLLYILFCWCLAGSVGAQGLVPVEAPRRWSLAPDVGVMMFYGDIPAQLGTNVGFFAGYHLTPKWQVQAGGRWSDVRSRAGEAYGRQFQNDMITYQARILYGLGQALLTDRFAPKLQPYVVVGFGGIYNNVTGVSIVDTPDDARNYTGSAFSANAGFGLQYYINGRLDLRLELEHQFATSDWIDGNNFQGGSNRAKDQLTFLHVGLAIKLGKKNAPSLAWRHLDPRTRARLSRLLTEAPPTTEANTAPSQGTATAANPIEADNRPEQRPATEGTATQAATTASESTAQTAPSPRYVVPVQPWVAAWQVIGGSTTELLSARLTAAGYVDAGFEPTIQYMDMDRPMTLRIYRVSLAQFPTREAAAEYLRDLRRRLNANFYLVPPR